MWQTWRLWHMASGSCSKIHASLLFLTSLICFKLFKMAWTYVHTTLLYTFSSFSTIFFCADFPYPQIFKDNFPNVVAVHAQFTMARQSFSQWWPLTPCSKCSTLTSLSHWRTPTSGVILHTLALFFELFVPIKSLWSQHHQLYSWRIQTTNVVWVVLFTSGRIETSACFVALSSLFASRLAT